MLCCPLRASLPPFSAHVSLFRTAVLTVAVTVAVAVAGRVGSGYGWCWCWRWRWGRCLVFVLPSSFIHCLGLTSLRNPPSPSLSLSPSSRSGNRGYPRQRGGAHARTLAAHAHAMRVAFPGAGSRMRRWDGRGVFFLSSVFPPLHFLICFFSFSFPYVEHPSIHPPAYPSSFIGSRPYMCV